jgi:hypothetical protein
MKLGDTILYVPGVTAAVELYEKAFALSRWSMDESGTYGDGDRRNCTRLRL